MNIENLNGLLAYNEYHRAIESGENFADILEKKPTQGESHQLETIQKILLALEEFGELNTSSIKLKTGLSWNSITWAMKRLREKNITVERTEQDRKNNEKLYHLRRNRAIIYINHQINWKKTWPKWAKKFKDIHKINKIQKHYSKDLKNCVISVPDDLRKKYDIEETTSKISDLPFYLAREIMLSYHDGYYCYDCFDKHIISELRRKENVTYCTTCGKEKYLDNY